MMAKPMSATGIRTRKCDLCPKPMTRTRRFPVDPTKPYGPALADAKEKARAWSKQAPEGAWAHPACLEREQIPGQLDLLELL